MKRGLEECLGGGFTSVRMATPTALAPEKSKQQALALGTVKYFIRTRPTETAPRGGCFMIVVGSSGGENGVVLADQEGGLSFPQILEKHRAMAACTGANSRL